MLQGMAAVSEAPAMLTRAHAGRAGATGTALIRTTGGAAPCTPTWACTRACTTCSTRSASASTSAGSYSWPSSCRAASVALSSSLDTSLLIGPLVSFGRSTCQLQHRLGELLLGQRAHERAALVHDGAGHALHAEPARQVLELVRLD